MNLMGIGLLELLVILLVAFMALGPSRSISMARTAGKVMSDLRRTFTEVAAAAGMEQATQPANARTASRPVPAARSNDQVDDQAPVGEETAAEEEETTAEQSTEGEAEPSVEQPTAAEAELSVEQPTAAEAELSVEQPTAGEAEPSVEQPTAGEDSPPASEPTPKKEEAAD